MLLYQKIKNLIFFFSKSQKAHWYQYILFQCGECGIYVFLVAAYRYKFLAILYRYCTLYLCTVYFRTLILMESSFVAQQWPLTMTPLKFFLWLLLIYEIYDMSSRILKLPQREIRSLSWDYRYLHQVARLCWSVLMCMPEVFLIESACCSLHPIWMGLIGLRVILVTICIFLFVTTVNADFADANFQCYDCTHSRLPTKGVNQLPLATA